MLSVQSSRSLNQLVLYSSRSRPIENSGTALRHSMKYRHPFFIILNIIIFIQTYIHTLRNTSSEKLHPPLPKMYILLNPSPHKTFFSYVSNMIYSLSQTILIPSTTITKKISTMMTINLMKQKYTNQNYPFITWICPIYPTISPIPITMTNPSPSTIYSTIYPKTTNPPPLYLTSPSYILFSPLPFYIYPTLIYIHHTPYKPHPIENSCTTKDIPDQRKCTLTKMIQSFSHFFWY